MINQPGRDGMVWYGMVGKGMAQDRTGRKDTGQRGVAAGGRAKDKNTPLKRITRP